MAELIQSIELLNVNLIRCDFEVFNPEEAPNGGSIEFFCEVNLIENDTDNNFEVQSVFEVKGFREDEDLFNLKEHFNAIFTKVNSEVFDNASKELQVQFCVSLIYPTLRENALYTLNKAGLGQINIPFHFSSPEVSQIS